MQFYQHSGRGGTWGVPLAAICGIVAAIVLGFVYAYVVNWIPFIYVSCLATAAFGFGVGAAVAWGAKAGKMRNMTIATVVGGLVGLIAVYFAWVFDPMARFPQQVAVPLWQTESIWEYMKLGYAEGFWSLGRGGGGAVTGPFLAAVWIAEGVLIAGAAGFTVSLLLGNQPFCEETNQWTKSEKNVARLSLVDDGQAEAKLQRLMAGEIIALTEFYRADGAEPAQLELDVATCADCQTCKFLTVRMVQHVVNKKGEVAKEETKLLVNLQVSGAELETIRAAGIDRPAEIVESQSDDEITAENDA